MEPNSPSGSNEVPKGSYRYLDLQGSMQVCRQRNPRLYQPQGAFSFGGRDLRDSQVHSSGLDISMGERRKSSESVSDDDEMNSADEDIDGQNNGVGDDANGPLWQRVKWTEKMVRLLITAVSYIGEDALSFDCVGGGRRKPLVSQKVGKWKCVSTAMIERGYLVSPQQCEDKFNDLNKRYKKLNEVLGRGTSCKVVENPKLLDIMDIPEKAKDAVRKILSSKHLFYEEMCSYHNGNRLFLPHDPELQLSLQLASGSKDDFEMHDTKRSKVASFDKERGAVDDRREDSGEMLGLTEKSTQADECDLGTNNSLKNPHCHMTSNLHSQNLVTDLNQFYPKESETEELQKQWMTFRVLQLEEQKGHIKSQQVEIEKLRFKWKRKNWKHDMELDRMRLENERMKHENEHLALQIKCKKMSAVQNQMLQ